MIAGDRLVAGLEIGRSGAEEARAALGAPSTLRRAGPAACVAAWRPLGATLRFVAFEGRPCARGVLLTATVTRRAGWRTARGLRVGDPVARVRRLYPGARFRRAPAGWTGWWLVPRRACAEVGSAPYPGLLARVARGRVAAIVAASTACE